MKIREAFRKERLAQHKTQAAWLKIHLCLFLTIQK